MTPGTVVVLWALAAGAGLLLLYVVVRLAVLRGTTAALRRHEAWMRDGSLEAALDKHAQRLARRAQQHEEDRRQLGLQRGEPPTS